ncbi:MAG: cytochrome P450 [Acidimicrobiia bacterium]
MGKALERDAVPVLAVLRRLKPVLPTPRFTLVLRDADVRSVLADPDAFTVALYTAKMDKILRGFALAVDDPSVHAESRAVLDLAFLPGDDERLAARTAALAAGALSSHDGFRPIDVATGLARPVLGAVVAEHLGIPAPDPTAFATWSHDVFRQVFLNPDDDQAVARRADAAHAALRAAAAAPGPAPVPAPVPADTVRRRLEEAGLAPDAVTANLVAMAVAWVPNTATSFTLAMAELLGRPRPLAGARQAAAAGDDARLSGYLLEALRFRPPHPGIPRMCVRDRALAGTRVRAGTPVVALTKSAMRDGAALRDPRRFLPDRPLADYLTFGFGRHTCPGAGASVAQLTALARSLLVRNPVRRGRVGWDGPYPARFAVTFDR